MPVANGEEKLFPQAGMKPGLQIWRIESFQPVKVSLPDDPKKGGPKKKEKPSVTFYKGDSYIILQTILTGKDANIFFWLGPESSQDEQGAAALLAVRLDEELGGFPKQHRLVGGHEDEQFKSLFKTMSIKKGGYATGFKEGKKTFEKALLQVKGRKNVLAFEVPFLIDSLNLGDCFVMDCGRKIYVWIGKGSNKKERLNALLYAQELRDEERAGLAVVSFTDTQEELEEFFLLLTGQKRIVAITKEGKSDEDHDENMKRHKKTPVNLFRVKEDSTGNIAMKETGSKPLKREDLDSDDTFILETGVSVYVWQGKKSSRKEKNKAFKDAEGFLAARSQNTSTPIKVIKEDLEPTEFKQFFWPWERVTAYGETITSSAGSITSKDKIEKKFGKFEVKSMHDKRGPASIPSLPDDGSGTVKVWRISNFKSEEVPTSSHGVFYSGDCYVILYTYMKNNRERHIIYFWLGNDSTSDEQGMAAAFATEKDDEFNGEPYQVRVCEGKEPLHFLMIFNCHLVIFQGGHASGYANLKTERDTTGASSKVRLLQVRVTQMKTSPTTSVPVHRVVEVAPFAQSLNSSDVFILCNKGTCFIWVGKGSIGDEKTCAKEVLGRIGKESEDGVILEGKEEPPFWEKLGGKAEYASAKQIWAEVDGEHYGARLFLCSNASGRFVCEEIYDFSQEDLEEDDVMILDAWTQLFIWVGDTARKDEKEEAIKTALEYAKTDTRERDSSKDKVTMSVIKQGKEPVEFKSYFIAWEPQMWNKKMSYEDRLKAIKQGNEKVDQNAFTWAEWNERLKPKSYSLEVLQKKGEELPEDVDVTSKEMHLEDTEFKEHFRMSKEEWERVPKWKKDQRKKELDLF